MMLGRFVDWFNKSGYFQSLLGILLFQAVAAWLLAPLLDVVPALPLFGLISLLLLLWLRRKTFTTDPSLIAFSVLVVLCGSVTLALYGSTLYYRHDGTWFWWVLLGIASICIGLLVAWLAFQVRKRRQRITD
jgi:hypothetical protein